LFFACGIVTVLAVQMLSTDEPFHDFLHNLSFQFESLLFYFEPAKTIFY
jgi:hypothetical protein